MATNRFFRRLAQVLRETADLRAQSWRHEVIEAGWAPSLELVAPCSCCHRRVLRPLAPSASHQRVAFRCCPDCDRLGGGHR